MDRLRRWLARRPGAVLAALLVVSTAVALTLTLYYHLGVPGLVVTFLLGLPGLYLGWVALRQPPDRSLAQVADELAARLRSQWADEAKARGLNDPYPLPVSWTAADPLLAGDLDALRTLAASGAGFSAPTRENWAKAPEDLVGGGDRKLVDVLAAVPTGRLVVLGEPGAGKTMLMVGLVLDLLHPDRRSSGGPVPVLAPLASWDPVSQDLHGWLGATLITDYPALAGVPPSESAGDNRFEALVEAGLILPVLDGLDEIPESARPKAITRINRELRPGERVVVTCRTEQYRTAVSPQDGQGAALEAAAVQLSTLEFGEVARYLRRDAGPAAEGRWSFLGTLSSGSPARQALATPLMAGLARAIYNPRPGELGGARRDPAELCSPALADQAAVESLLFGAFVPAAYGHDPAGRWKAQDADRWLIFLARHMERKIASPDLAWWQLRQAIPRSAFRLAAGLGYMLLAGLEVAILAGLRPGLRYWFVFGFVFGLAAGLAGGLAERERTEAPSRGMRISVRRLAGGLLFGVVFGPVSGVVLVPVFGAGLGVGLGAGLAAGLGVGLGAGLAGGLGAGLAGGSGDLATAASPRAVLARDRQAALLLMLIGGLAGGLGYGLGVGLRSGLAAGLGVGLAGGLGVGLFVSGTQTAWPSYMLTRGGLALRRRLPWSLMSFLTDAHERRVLRQAGAVYQFQHLELQRCLATRLEPTVAAPRGHI